MKANNEFTREERKIAKSNYKASLKNNVIHNQERERLIEYLVKQPFPNWNVKLSLLN